MEALPDFRYHPDPLSTGEVELSDVSCVCCGRARGAIYVGPVFSTAELTSEICPWCIDDGSAAERFDASFTDYNGEAVPESVVATVTKRTPGFTGWQQEHWMYHCRDGAAYLGRRGWSDLRQIPTAVDSIRADFGSYGWPEQELRDFLESITRDGSPSAYLFRCLHCSEHLAYADMD